MKSFDEEIVSGSILRSVWKIAWPVILTQVIAGSSGIVDQILIGNYVKEDTLEAQAAIGDSWQLFLVLLVFLSSLFHGMNIVIARYSGRQNHKAVNEVFFETFKLSVYLFFFVVAPVGYFLAPSMLVWVNAEPEVQTHALPYLRLLFVGSIPMFTVFLLNGAFQSTGYSKIPLYFGIITTVIKLATSYVLITGVGPFPEMGVVGAGIGTCLAPLPSVVFAFYLISQHKVILGLPEKMSFVPDWRIIKTVARIGIPSGIQAVLLNLGGVILLRFIGSLPNSAESQAAYNICYGQLFSLVTWAGFGLRAACATVIGQNIGAGKTERGRKSVFVGAVLGFFWALFFAIWYWFFPDLLLGWFGVVDSLALEIGTELLSFLAVSGLFVVVALAFTGGLQGAGDTKRPMVIAFITQMVVLLGICFFFDVRGQLTDTIIWSAILIAHFSRLILSLAIFLQGKWKHIKVELEEETVS
jgi:putative MATE family efflux protein